MKTLKVNAEKLTGQLTIRGVSTELGVHLREEAARKGWSLNRTVLELLSEATGCKQRATIHHDLDHLFGVWSEADGADIATVLNETRQVDEDLWQ